MTLVPLTECCLYLGVDPKTLRLWLQAAQISCCLHPTDARLKCLTASQLQQLAELHGRHLPKALPQTTPDSMSGVQTAVSTLPEPSPISSSALEADLRQQVSLLQQQVLTLHTQVTELALALLRLRETPHALSSCAPVPEPTMQAALSEPSAAPVTAARKRASIKSSSVHAVAPASSPARPRSRALPLIQVRPDGTVVVIAPKEGVLPLIPDSTAWFAWLSSIEAFSFECSSGHFSATRKIKKGQRIQAWHLHRSLHGRSCSLYLGLTKSLTLLRLEEMAAAAHARLTAL
jgi:hypothetical protein